MTDPNPTHMLPYCTMIVPDVLTKACNVDGNLAERLGDLSEPGRGGYSWRLYGPYVTTTAGYRHAMFSATSQNSLYLAMAATLAGDSVDLRAAQKAFEETPGDFRAKFTAAVEARLGQVAVPEVFIDVPEDLDKLSKAQLDALVRQAADGFLRSHPTKGELVDQVTRIRQRQESRPAWIPRVDRNGEPILRTSVEDDRVSDRPLRVTVLPELGEITVRLPAAGDGRPELAMAAGGAGEWESALFAVLGLSGCDATARTIMLNAAANEALVPEESRWWSTGPSPSVSAAADPGVASELLATCELLGGLPVINGTSPEVLDAVARALESAGDWRYSPQWQLEPVDPGGDAATLAVARAAIAGWANEQRSGLIVYVYGGALYASEGLVGFPTPLHSYLLVVSRSADGADSVDTVHRLNLSCPGEHWCCRGGCPDTGVVEADAPLTLIVTRGHAAAAASGNGKELWRRSYQDLYGNDDRPEDSEQVLDQLVELLESSGWVELSESSWEGGMQERLLRRHEYCLTASYDPVTRQIELSDGYPALELALQILAEEGALVDDNGQERLDTSEVAIEDWGADLLTAADDMLGGRIKESTRLASPAQITVLGLHPYADGSLHAPEAPNLAEMQLRKLCEVVGVSSTET